MGKQVTGKEKQWMHPLQNHFSNNAMFRYSRLRIQLGLVRQTHNFIYLKTLEKQCMHFEFTQSVTHAKHQGKVMIVKFFKTCYRRHSLPKSLPSLHNVSLFLLVFWVKSYLFGWNAICKIPLCKSLRLKEKSEFLDQSVFDNLSLQL